MSFSKSWNCTNRFAECNFAFWKTHKCKLIPNWTRNTVWLPINNIHEKNCVNAVKDVLNFTDSELSSQFCARAKPQVILIITQSRKNCAIIDNIRIPRRPWDESLLNMNARLMRGPSLGNKRNMRKITAWGPENQKSIESCKLQVPGVCKWSAGYRNTLIKRTCKTI